MTKATKKIEPKPEFRSLTESEIEQALADNDPANPIAVELARLIEGYSANFAAYCEQLGRIPENILHITPRWPIEAVAMRLVTKTIVGGLRGGEHDHMKYNELLQACFDAFKKANK